MQHSVPRGCACNVVSVGVGMCCLGGTNSRGKEGGRLPSALQEGFASCGICGRWGRCKQLAMSRALAGRGREAWRKA